MTQQTTSPEGDAEVTDASVNAVSPEMQALIDSIKANPQTVAEEMKALRAEAKQRRLDATKADRDRQAADNARLEADKEWEKAATAYKKQLDDLTPKAQRADEAYAFLQEMASRRIAGLPKHFQSLVDPNDPIKALTWLEANAALLNLPTLPQTDAAVTGDRGLQLPVSAKEAVANARAMGMSDVEITEMEKFLAKQKK